MIIPQLVHSNCAHYLENYLESGIQNRRVFVGVLLWFCLLSCTVFDAN